MEESLNIDLEESCLSQTSPSTRSRDERMRVNQELQCPIQTVRKEATQMHPCVN
jgi:hypothetical protein